MSISVGESGNILMSFMSSLMCAECIISCCLSKSNYYTHWVWESKWKANLCCSSMYLSLAPLFLSIAHKYIPWKNRLMKFIIHIRMSKTVKTKIKWKQISWIACRQQLPPQQLPRVKVNASINTQGMLNEKNIRMY